MRTLKTTAMFLAALSIAVTWNIFIACWNAKNQVDQKEPFVLVVEEADPSKLPCSLRPRCVEYVDYDFDATPDEYPIPYGHVNFEPLGDSNLR